MRVIPATSIQIPWRIARATRAMMAPTIICLELVGDFFSTWAIFYRGNDDRRSGALRRDCPGICRCEGDVTALPAYQYGDPLDVMARKENAIENRIRSRNCAHHR